MVERTTFRAPTTIEKGIIVFLVAFLLVFPKGGIKVAGVPLTWGYLSLGPLFLSFPLGLLVGRARPVMKTRLLSLLTLLPFQIVIWAALLTRGTSNTGFAISLIIAFFFLPVVFVLVLGIHLDRLDLAFVFRLLRIAVFSVALYGIFLFIYKLKTGSFVEIPYLTVNAGDVGELENKHINRGGIFKLISTYNNGNIYGVSILMLLPLYAWLEKSRTKTLVVKASLLLTLSRTVWVGLILYEILARVYVKRVSGRTLAILGVSLVLMTVGIGAVMTLMGADVSFLLDRKLGGRIGQWRQLDTATVLPTTRFEAIVEIVYLSVLESFGLLGLLGFLVAMTTPVLLQLAGAVPFGRSPYKRSVAAGLIIYLAVAMSDGAMLFIPVMAFYWFLVSLLLSPNPSFEGIGVDLEEEASGPPPVAARRWPAIAQATPPRVGSWSH
jgi:hypothetical protein